MRTARLSTSGGLEANCCACAVRELPAKVAISAVTKPAPPEQSKPRLEIDEPLQLQLQVPNSMAESPRLKRQLHRFIRSPRRRVRAASLARPGQAPWRS